MQVVEHLWDQPGYVAESARVLRPGGTLVLSTPNRLTFSPGHDPASGPPTNPFHTREFSAPELADLLSPHFPDITRYGLHHGPRLRAVDRRFQREYGQDLVASQLATPATDWSTDLHTAVAAVSAADFLVEPDDTDTALDLIYVSRKPRS
jgi:SAM-dependent methyltransferase